MPRIALGLEYDGTDFVGWQVQGHGRSVQHVVGAAITAVANEPVAVNGAGRTDAGVHAAGQVGHFDTQASRSERQWLLGINSNLPADVAAKWVVRVPEDFDARRSAIWREYRYTILNHTVRSALARRRSWRVREPLDPKAMTQAAAYWLGERDFSAFRAAHCQSYSPVRRLLRVAIARDGPWLRLDFRASAFLYHMVRNMVGALVAVGTGRSSVAAASELLASRDRGQAGITAPAAGLSLTAVAYDPQFRLPDSLNSVTNWSGPGDSR